MKEQYRDKEEKPYKPKVGDIVYIRFGKAFDRGEITQVREDIKFHEVHQGGHPRTLEGFVEIDESIQVHPSRVIDPKHTDQLDYLLRVMTNDEFWGLVDAMTDWNKKREELNERTE